jgi:UDP-N-acetylglucosamine--N-acetylmuramyl-(pentapeptide) pyrophosphoryl-undecaprenol N-acetylglucosamine transferase
MRVWQFIGMPTLLIAGAGGHLEELWHLRPRLVPLDDDVLWVTSDTPQSRSLLAAEQRLFAPPARPRDAGAAVANLRFSRHVLALCDWTDAVSTGPLMAVPFLTLARAQGIRCHFVESPARVTGPSLSARILERVPGVQCYSPYRWWRRPSWTYRGSVLDRYAPAPSADPELRRVVVTVGTSGYGFERLVRRLAAVLPRDCDVFWQTGATDVSGLDIDARPFVADHELATAMAVADLVICHAGVGSALAAMRAGRAPLLVARRAGHGEHVDDHQIQIAAELERRGLALSCEPEDLEPALLWKAASGRVTAAGSAPPFRLEQRRPLLREPLVWRRATA